MEYYFHQYSSLIQVLALWLIEMKFKSETVWRHYRRCVSESRGPRVRIIHGPVSDPEEDILDNVAKSIDTFPGFDAPEDLNKCYLVMIKCKIQIFQEKSTIYLFIHSSIRSITYVWPIRSLIQYFFSFSSDFLS